MLDQSHQLLNDMIKSSEPKQETLSLELSSFTVPKEPILRTSPHHKGIASLDMFFAHQSSSSLTTSSHITNTAVTPQYNITLTYGGLRDMFRDMFFAYQSSNSLITSSHTTNTTVTPQYSIALTRPLN